MTPPKTRPYLTGWLGRGCLCRGGNADPGAEPAAPGLYRGPAGCHWSGGAVPREEPLRAAELSAHSLGTVPTPNPGVLCAQPHGLVWAAPGAGLFTGSQTKC